MTKKKHEGPWILALDIETAPILAHVWSLWDERIGLNQVKQDWYIISWAAKWLHDPASKVFYEDQRNAKNIEDDSKLLKNIWKLIDKADVILTQNGKRFDEKKLNTRFIVNGYQPPSSFQHIDTLQIAKRKFGFTSNKLEYMTDKLCTKRKKYKHAKFSGFELWKECLAGNIKAWKEMEKYNKLDVLSLEELYLKLQPWDNTLNVNLYTPDNHELTCACGSKEFKKNGYKYTSVGKYQRYKCTKCGSETKDRTNLFSKEKKKNLRTKT